MPGVFRESAIMAKKRRIGYSTTMKRCTVSFVDSAGISHSVELDAGSLFEAVAGALEAFKQTQCASRFPEHLRVQVRTKDGQYSVGVAELRRWIGRATKSPKQLLLKKRIEALVAML